MLMEHVYNSDESQEYKNTTSISREDKIKVLNKFMVLRTKNDGINFDKIDNNGILKDIPGIGNDKANKIMNIVTDNNLLKNELVKLGYIPPPK